MRIQITAVLATPAATAAADSMTVHTVCPIIGNCDSRIGTWHSAFGNYLINADEGCRDPPDVPGMNRICMDWGNGRAHFFLRWPEQALPSEDSRS